MPIGPPDDERPPSRAELRLMGRAIRQRWPMDDDTRAKVMAKLVDVIDDEESGARDVIAAGKALIDVDKLNLEQERLDFSRSTAQGEFEEVVVRRVARRIDAAPGADDDGGDG